MGVVRAAATWSGGLFDAARGGDIGRRIGVICESSATWIRARRGAGLVLDRERRQLRDGESGRQERREGRGEESKAGERVGA